MNDQLRNILIIIISVSIFGLLIFVFVKNYIKSKIHYYLEEKNKKTKEDL
jgi:FtsZ-interacting cell division protein ZipA